MLAVARARQSARPVSDPLIQRTRSIGHCCATLPPDQFMGMHRTLRAMRKQLGQSADWRAELDRMKTGAVVGCLHVETKTMRTELLQVPNTIMQQARPSCALAALCVTAVCCW